MKVRVKICGITSTADARAAVDAGADALGFMFYPRSPRFLEAATARAIIDTLPPFVARVGVFVDATADEILRIVAQCGLDTVQLHGAESPELCRCLRPLSVIKAFRVQDAGTLEQLTAYEDFSWLLDSYVAGEMGGTGRTFNWELAATAVRRGGMVLLAGGLHPGNVAAAIAAVKPWAVDVSSGVEQAPGRKDAAKMRAFVRAVTAAGSAQPGEADHGS